MSAVQAPIRLQRSVGEGLVCVKAADGASRIADLRMSGSLKLLFGRGATRVDGIVINSSGGLTGWDRVRLSAEVQPRARLALTTQAAERAYRASDGVAQVENKLEVADEASLFWLPQELILFNGAALNRRLMCDLAPSARLLLVEPVVFGRPAMGERLDHVQFSDRVEINREGRPLFRDVTQVDGDAVAHLARRAVGQGAGAMALILYVGPDASARVDQVRALLPTTGGAALVGDDLLQCRLLAPDGFGLRKYLLPILDLLSTNTLPVSWRL